MHVAEPAPPADDTGRRHRAALWRELGVPLALALVIALLLNAFLVQAFFIPSGSMERTLHGCPGCPGDRILVDKLVHDLRDVRRGEIVVFSGEGSWGGVGALPPEQGGPLARGLTGLRRAVGAAPPSDSDYVKRVIGLPGDRVACCTADGRVTVQPAGAQEAVALDEPYLFQDDNLPFCALGSGSALCPAGAEAVLVPAGHLWVMGDHRSASQDSRVNGTIPQDDVIGRAFAIVWPPSRAGLLAAPDILPAASPAGG